MTVNKQYRALYPRKTLSQALRQPISDILVTGTPLPDHCYSKPVEGEWERVLRMREEEHYLVKGGQAIENRGKRIGSPTPQGKGIAKSRRTEP